MHLSSTYNKTKVDGHSKVIARQRKCQFDKSENNAKA